MNQNNPYQRIDLCDALYSWAIKPIGKSKCHYRLKDWQQMASWVNWALNVFPLLRPCLNTFYSKMSGSHIPTCRIWVNNSVQEDLIWAARHIESSSRVHILQAVSWDLDTADLVAYCDACPEGMGFWYPSTSLAFQAPTPENSPVSVIFYFEALCVFCALRDIATQVEPGARVVIFTDNLNTVQMFNSLACLPDYNQLLRHSVDILLAHRLDLHVLHVPGEQNVVADALSRCQFSTALNAVNNLRISPFQPPRWTLGATEK